MDPVLGRAVDVVLVIALLDSLAYMQRVWPVEYSPTRSVFVFYLLALSALLGRFWRRVSAPVLASTLLIGVLVVVGHVTWTANYSWQTATNYWQDWRLMVGFLAFGAAYGTVRWRSWRVTLLVAGLSVAAVQAFGLVTGNLTQGGGDASFYYYRQISASAALLMIVGMLILLLDSPVEPRLSAILGSLLGVSIVVCQHRSVWLSLSVILVLSSMRLFRERSPALAWAPIAATLALWVTTLLLAAVARVQLLPGAGSDSGARLPEAAASSGSVEWRLEMWRTRLVVARSLDDVLFGGTFGPTMALGPDAMVMNPANSAHNLILDQWIMLGLVGLVAVSVLVVTVLVGSRDRLSLVPVMTWGMLAFGVFYNWPPWFWLLIGVGSAAAYSRSNVPNGATLRTQHRVGHANV